MIEHERPITEFIRGACGYPEISGEVEKANAAILVMAAYMT